MCGALNAVRLTDISVEKGRAAAEMMLMGNTIKDALVVIGTDRRSAQHPFAAVPFDERI